MNEGYKEIVKELRFAVEYGCDSGLIERAADALEEAADKLERGEQKKSGKTIYLQVDHFCRGEDMLRMQNNLNKESTDNIVVLPAWVKLLNPADLEKVCKEMLGVASPSETIRDHTNKVIVPEIEAFLGRMENCIGQVIEQETKEK